MQQLLTQQDCGLFHILIVKFRVCSESPASVPFRAFHFGNKTVSFYFPLEFDPYPFSIVRFYILLTGGRFVN